ncbi:4-hydroxy-tetrahydrodipicolinate reductase [Collinsella sp. An2]|uniref:4-hydroxy-tetrahydrodipicolinate reductase n=1 Tax=Collinsella sp. An2 TaxID=1965585 RepID=UPI000B3854EF|nr:4-hydroxy-tetrahydrodipicolinate reductase [Collinsella sp. An2]
MIVGAGRMGTLIRRLAEEALDTDGLPAFDIVGQVGSNVEDLRAMPAADVTIDFSNASTLDAVAAYVTRTGTALVSGTTGYTDAQMSALRELSEQAPILWSGNYSLGVAALRHLVAQAAHELPGFDVEIVECHHNQKADAPSGTAKMLLDAVVDNKGDAKAHAVYGREGACGARDPHEIGVHALRGGTVAGTHTVSFFGPSEEVSLTHRAESREIFARGALAAAQKLAGKPAGFYTFDEVMFS